MFYVAKIIFANNEILVCAFISGRCFGGGTDFI